MSLDMEGVFFVSPWSSPSCASASSGPEASQTQEDKEGENSAAASGETSDHEAKDKRDERQQPNATRSNLVFEAMRERRGEKAPTLP